MPAAMPIYEYRCANGHSFEAFQSMSEDPISKCAECGASCERVLSAPAVHFKGSGFYTTDYARKPKKTSASDSGGGDSDSGKDSKPDSGGETKAKSSSGGGDSKAKPD